MTVELKDSIKTLLEFYGAFGFESLPLKYSDGLSVMSNEFKEFRKSENTSLVMHHSLHEKQAALNELREEIGDCQRCRLSKDRKNIVFGEGNANARIMFIGEAPGREEDLQGMPFVGDAGQVLTNLINKMGEGRGFMRKDVYIANIVKCRPPMNRDPQDDEIKTCLPFLNRQIEIISPMVIIALGKVSSHTILGISVPLAKFSITRVRGRFYEYEAGGRIIPVMPTFHPAYFLRNPKDKYLTWNDAQAVLKKIDSMEGTP